MELVVESFHVRVVVVDGEDADALDAVTVVIVAAVATVVANFLVAVTSDDNLVVAVAAVIVSVTIAVVGMEANCKKKLCTSIHFGLFHLSLCLTKVGPENESLKVCLNRVMYWDSLATPKLA